MSVSSRQTLKRTIRRVSHPLNRGKWQALNDLARRYAVEKNTHLCAFASDATFVVYPSERAYRDELVANGYTSSNGLQARMWKMTLKDAYETVGKQWIALSAELRPRIAQHADWTKAQKRYAFWLLQLPQRLAQLVAGKASDPTHFEIAYTERRPVQNYLRRVIQRVRGGRPGVKKARSLALDADMYTLFEKNGTQYIKVMSLIAGQRIVIPLTGHTPIGGNVRLVLDSEQRRVEIHYTAEVKVAPALKGEPCGLDAGVSEVFTDEKGERYGMEFGKVLTEASDRLSDKGRKRNKLHQIAKQAEVRGNRDKARCIGKFNLGRKKLRRTRRKVRAELSRQINTAINQVVDTCQPSVIVTEQLDIRGKARSKRLSRIVSLWTRSLLKERVDFKASAGGSSRKQVNPAYSSQTCPACGFVHADNRRGDTFQCLHCRYAGYTDQVAAANLKARFSDPKITLWTPKERVKAILLARFIARLESGRSSATVSGRTPGAALGCQPESETTGAISPGERENVGAKRDHI